MNKETCNITRKFTKKTAATRIQQFMQKSRRKMDTVRRPTGEDSSTKRGPTTPEIREFVNKVHARRLSRFMKKVNPEKRRSAFLNGVCSDAGVCIAFGKETATIKKHFDNFSNFRYLAKPAKRVGIVSSNGFVKELTYERAGYTAHAILKSSAKTNGDNLYYEYLVGKYINKRALNFPCFVETYEMFSYRTSEIHAKMRDRDETAIKYFEDGLVPYSEVSADTTQSLALSCHYSLLATILIQHIKDAKSIADRGSDIEFVSKDLLYVLFQIYMPLAEMSNEFTHYDLHADNVLVYEPVKESYIHYHYHVGVEVVSFKSSYIAKIIDYGRSFFNDSENPDISGSSKKIYDEVCGLIDCRPNCGKTLGYEWMGTITKATQRNAYYISSQIRNRSHDLRLLEIIAHAYNKTTYNSSFKKMSRNVNIYAYELFAICSKVKYGTLFGTPEMTKSGLPSKIYTVNDARIALQNRIMNEECRINNENHYVGKAKLGDMHVYSDGRPLRFVSAV